MDDDYKVLETINDHRQYWNLVRTPRHRCIADRYHKYVTLYNTLILNRIAPIVEGQVIKEQAGVRIGNSCTCHMWNFTEHIHDCLQRDMITGAAFLDLSAAYDTVNHIILIQLLYNTTHKSHYVEPSRTCCLREDYMWSYNERSRGRMEKRDK